ncbi:hypothetical protein UCRNP2_5890 [Neofusicoccum parvum UCRNP2]|uniref:Uncharacterized protein n=1 Tax=Botryosphaeria parva (strain UCR-NP2) TaxID=1287680 RepID=R1EHV5_BOTPV|nr:hypothetical protein UCRNP2_5890 [Neofusicoccum parvum UCRNP2]
MTRVPVASPPDPQDEPITCLVTAIHIIASSVPHPSSAETDPFFWRHALAAFVRGGTSAAAKRPPIITAALVPPMIIPLSIAAFFTHLETHLATTRTRHNADLARLRTRARSYEGTYALLDALASGPNVTTELAAYAARDAQLPGAIENVESTIASLQRLGIDGTVRDLEACARGLREVRRRDDARVARLKDMEAVRESIRGGLAALEERDKAEMERLEGAPAEAWRQAEVAWAGLKGRFGGEGGGG